MIILQRVLAGKLITELPPEHVDHVCHNEQIEELVYHLEITYNVTPSQWKRSFISFPSSIDVSHICNSLLADEGPLADYLQKMIRKIHHSAVVEFDEDLLSSGMRDHLRNTMNRLAFHVECHDSFYGKIERQYPLAYGLAKIDLQELGRLLNRCVPTVEFGYLALYFELALRGSYEAKVKKEIAVICSTGHGTVLIIQRQLRKVLGPDVQIAHFSEEGTERKELNRYFAIFTTISLRNIRPQTPMIHLTNLFNDTQLRNEQQRAKEIHPAGFQNIHMIYRLLENTQGYRANIQKMVADLEVEKSADPQLIERISAREDQQTVIFESGIAFPYTVNQALSMIILSIGVFEGSLVIPESEVDVISLLGIPEELTAAVEVELPQLCDHLLTIAGNERLRSELRKQRDVLAVEE